MSTLTCPHCGKPVELVSQSELTKDYGLKPNPVAHARKLGNFPEPVLWLGNRYMYLRSDIDAYVDGKKLDKLKDAVNEAYELIEKLPEEERARALEMLGAK